MKTKKVPILIYLLVLLLIIISCGKSNSSDNIEVDKENNNEIAEVKDDSKEHDSKEHDKSQNSNTSDDDMVEDIEKTMDNLSDVDLSNVEKKMADESKSLSKHIDSDKNVKDIDTLRENIFGWYDLVEPGMTIEEIEGILNVKGVENEPYYGTVIVIFREPDGARGLSVGYEEGDSVIHTKQAYYSSMTSMSVFTPGDFTEKQSEEIKEGMTYEEVREIMGVECVEIIKFYQKDIGGFRGCAWINDNGSYLQVNFDIDDNTVDFAYFNKTGF